MNLSACVKLGRCVFGETGKYFSKQLDILQATPGTLTLTFRGTVLYLKANGTMPMLIDEMLHPQVASSTQKTGVILHEQDL